MKTNFLSFFKPTGGEHSSINELKDLPEEGISNLNNDYYVHGYDYNCSYNNDEEESVEEEENDNEGEQGEELNDLHEEGIWNLNNDYNEAVEEEEENDNEDEQDLNTSNASSDSFVSVRLSNPNVFDCCVCSRRLTIPVYLCGNGHAACSTCSTCSAAEETFCGMCYSPIGTNRCTAIENVLESMEMPCQNATYGCKEILSYNEMNEHDNKCIYVSCFCPYPACNFAAPSNELYSHFSHKHEGGAVPFKFDEFFNVFVRPDADPILLQENSDSTLFILNNSVESLGCIVSISCFGPNSSQLRYAYSIIVYSTKRCGLMLREVANNIQLSTVYNPSSGFLVIPFGYFDSSGPLRIAICIKNSLHSAE